MSESVEVMLFEEIRSEAERSFALGDVLDMKANVWLVVIIFLATQTAYFLSKGLSGVTYDGQIVSAVVLILAGILTLLGLRPRDYMFFSPSNGVIEKRVEQLQEHYRDTGDAEPIIQSQIRKDQIGWSKASISSNRKINDLKSRLVSWAFWLTAFAATVNLMTLASFVKLPF